MIAIHIQISSLLNAQGGGGTLWLKMRGGGWLDCLESGILVGKIYFGFFQKIDLDTIVSQPSKCLKFMTFREGCFVIRN